MNFMKKCFKMLIMLFKYQHSCLLYKSAATYYHFSKHEKESILLAFENSDFQPGNTFQIVSNFWEPFHENPQIRNNLKCVS